MPSKISPAIFLFMFLGGALGASSRYAIELSLAAAPLYPLISTSIVNLLGALALGFVNGQRYFQNLNRKMFFGHGFLGSFTTMSGLALITAGTSYGLGENGFVFWLFAMVQLVAGVFSYRFGLVIGRSRT